MIEQRLPLTYPFEKLSPVYIGIVEDFEAIAISIKQHNNPVAPDRLEFLRSIGRIAFPEEIARVVLFLASNARF